MEDCHKRSCWKNTIGVKCSETVRVGRVRVFRELPTVFNCSVLAFGVQESSIVNREPRVRCIINDRNK
jgi:hypothetical protein